MARWKHERLRFRCLLLLIHHFHIQPRRTIDGQLVWRGILCCWWSLIAGREWNCFFLLSINSFIYEFILLVSFKYRLKKKKLKYLWLLVSFPIRVLDIIWRGALELECVAIGLDFFFRPQLLHSSPSTYHTHVLNAATGKHISIDWRTEDGMGFGVLRWRIHADIPSSSIVVLCACVCRCLPSQWVFESRSFWLNAKTKIYKWRIEIIVFSISIECDAIEFNLF